MIGSGDCNLVKFHPKRSIYKVARYAYTVRSQVLAEVTAARTCFLLGSVGWRWLK